MLAYENAKILVEIVGIIMKASAKNENFNENHGSERSEPNEAILITPSYFDTTNNYCA